MLLSLLLVVGDDEFYFTEITVPDFLCVFIYVYFSIDVQEHIWQEQNERTGCFDRMGMKR